MHLLSDGNSMKIVIHFAKMSAIFFNCIQHLDTTLGGVDESLILAMVMCMIWLERWLEVEFSNFLSEVLIPTLGYLIKRELRHELHGQLTSE